MIRERIVKSSGRIVLTRELAGEFYVLHGRAGAGDTAASGPFAADDPRFSESLERGTGETSQHYRET